MPTTAKTHAFSLGTFGKRADCQPLVDALHGESYMNFQVSICPAAPGFEVWASTSYDCSEKQASEMLLYLMATSIRRLATGRPCHT